MVKNREEGKIQKFWDEHVGEFFNDKPSEFLYNFFSKVKNKKQKVLDLGCGAGRNTIMLHSLGFDIFGCDLNKKMVSAAKSRLPKNVADKISVADMARLSYGDSIFDFIVSNGVFHNAKNFAGFKKAVKEAARILKNNGHLIVNTFVAENFDTRIFTAQKLKSPLYITGDGLPIVLMPLKDLFGIFAQNNLKLLSFEVNETTVSTGEREVFKGIFKKDKNLEKEDIRIANWRSLIDYYDEKITKLVSKRISTAQDIIRLKARKGRPVTDGERENEIKARLIKFSKNEKLNISPSRIEKLASFLIRFSKSIK